METRRDLSRGWGPFHGDTAKVCAQDRLACQGMKEEDIGPRLQLGCAVPGSWLAHMECHRSIRVASVLWQPACAGIPGKARDGKIITWRDNHLNWNRSQMNCPTEVEFEFFKKAGNAFLSRSSLVQCMSKYLSALKCQARQISHPGTPKSVYPPLCWRLGTVTQALSCTLCLVVLSPLLEWIVLRTEVVGPFHCVILQTVVTRGKELATVT